MFSQFLADKEVLLQLLQHRSVLVLRFRQVLAVNALTSLRETVKTPDGTDRGTRAAAQTFETGWDSIFP